MATLTEDGRTADAGPSFDFGFRVSNVQMKPEAWQELDRASRLVFALDGSSWMPCDAEPRCLPECIAAEIFAQHTRGASFDRSRSGAEWWAQVRQCGHKEETIQFHWDTDEVAVEERNVNVHPHVATVTYVTSCGAPTLIVDRRNSRTPAETDTTFGPIREGFLSYPKVGKHVVFDGQLLHGTVPRKGDPQIDSGERVTFLVNVWLDHKPSNCRRADKSFARRLGSAETEVSLNASSSDALTSVEVPGRSQGEEVFESIFRRRGCAAFKEAENGDLKLRVPLPPLAAPGATELIKWSAGSGSEFGST